MHTKSWGMLQVVNKEMRDKVQTSLWLDRDVKMLIMAEGINLTKWVNDNILLSLSIDNEDDIRGKIKVHEASIKTLNKRLDTLKSTKVEGASQDLVAKQALDELREYFTPRGESKRSREQNLGWITSAKNVGRCRLLKKTPETVLNELEAWYDGKEKSKHEKD